MVPRACFKRIAPLSVRRSVSLGPWCCSVLFSPPMCRALCRGHQHRHSRFSYSYVFLSSDWLLSLMGDSFDLSDPRTPAGNTGTLPETHPGLPHPLRLFLHSRPWMCCVSAGDALITGPSVSLLCLFLKFSLRFYMKGVKFTSPGVRTSYSNVCRIFTDSLRTKSSIPKYKKSLLKAFSLKIFSYYNNNYRNISGHFCLIRSRSTLLKYV